MLHFQDPEVQISQCLKLLLDVFNKDLLGVYLYGSSTVGGLQKFSDIDIFVVSNRPTTYNEKDVLIGNLLKISGVYMKDTKPPIEITIVVRSEVNPWIYPPSFDFQYGDWLRKEFESGNLEPWSTKVKPNLALIITQILLRSKTLFGSEPNEILPEVPYWDFITALVEEIDSLLTDIEWDTRNVLLTLARIWCTVSTDKIVSKPTAAAWAIDRLPVEFQPPMTRALLISMGKEEEHWEDMQKQAYSCADFIIDKVKEQTASLEKEGYDNRSIKISD